MLGTIEHCPPHRPWPKETFECWRDWEWNNKGICRATPADARRWIWEKTSCWKAEHEYLLSWWSSRGRVLSRCSLRSGALRLNYYFLSKESAYLTSKQRLWKWYDNDSSFPISFNWARYHPLETIALDIQLNHTFLARETRWSTRARKLETFCSLSQEYPYSLAAEDQHNCVLRLDWNKHTFRMRQHQVKSGLANTFTFTSLGHTRTLLNSGMQISTKPIPLFLGAKGTTTIFLP